MDDIAVHAQAHLESVHLSGVAAGRDLDQGVLDLDANADGMKLNGRAHVGRDPGEAGCGHGFPWRSADTGAAER